MPSAENAIALKQKGNKAVAAHEWLNAVNFYTQAIEINDKDATFFCNRAQASGRTINYPRPN
jgi:serine/threonine-protein phosphatase 5